MITTNKYKFENVTSNLYTSMQEFDIHILKAGGNMNAYYKSMTNDDIYQALKEDILTLKLKPGQMISENEIASNYNVSRTPVKTAFLRLKGEKYIEILPQKGSFVTLLDMQYIKDIIYMRYVLEMDVIKTIISKGSYDDLMRELKTNLQQQLMLIEHDQPNPKNFYSIDSQFHYLLFQHAGRTKMWDIIQDCQVYYTRFRILDTLTTSRYLQLYQDHIEIYKLLEEKNIDKMQQHMHEHLHGNLKVLSQKIEGEYKDYFIQHE